ncbi:MAG: DUF202 domain-containing protein [Dissulfurimicrobium sp.]|uniref:DUF202 domain-containing protein n=1 Tax=Dissulfurimicrobium TaxID=1769732 RepID=UPI001EDB8DD7|nr:DUF202 domain-containing protein [Dissulfurimicrobium hydrothermale]UKL13558.1 DUF202 domain-containing protein [Dissulfurimicrobium hydrothermale]
MSIKKFERLVNRKLITPEALNEIIEESRRSGGYPEELLIERGLPKHEILFSLAEHYGYPFIEYDEKVAASYFITLHLDMERHKKALWFPIALNGDTAKVVIYDPDRPSITEEIKKTLKVEKIEPMIALPSDIIRIIENSFDVNPGFPQTAGRTPLAKVRTFLADRRSFLSCYRTSLARGRTGLAFLRTGISFIVISLTLLRIFGIRPLLIIEAPLLITGCAMIIDGLKWHLPAHNIGRKMLYCSATEPTWGTTLLEVSNPGDNPIFTRTAPIKGADRLRAAWRNLSPVMRRRFLASDRTDMAEERTVLACYRTIMARARTGLAFARTGIAFTGLGIALFRQFHVGPWTAFDLALIFTGVIMAIEGFYWYLPGRQAGVEGFESVKKAGGKTTIWDFVFPLPVFKHTDTEYAPIPPVKPSYSPGIWATTGLALERTLLADRRGVMARLRTIMARSRTGLAFIRTGMSVASVGLGLMVYFGINSIAWSMLNLALIIIGLISIADGLYWYLPAEKIKKMFPYCFGGMEITIPDYGTPARFWKKIVFSQ